MTTLWDLTLATMNVCMYVTLVYDDTSKTVNCKRKEQLGGAQQKLPAGPRIKRPARAIKA